MRETFNQSFLAKQAHKLADEQKWDEVLEFLKQLENPNVMIGGMGLAHKAAKFADVSVFLDLCALDCDFTLKDDDQNISLHYLAERGIVCRMGRQYYEIKNGAGETVSHIYARNGFADAYVTYVKDGANQHARDNKGNTPVHNCAKAGFLKINEDANLLVLNDDRQSIGHMAAIEGHLHCLLRYLQAGGSLYDKDVNDVSVIDAVISGEMISQNVIDGIDSLEIKEHFAEAIVSVFKRSLAVRDIETVAYLTDNYRFNSQHLQALFNEAYKDTDWDLMQALDSNCDVEQVRSEYEASLVEAERLAQERAAAEEAERLAQERAAAEEAERLAQERAAAEEAERLAQERAAAEEAERLAQEQAAAEEAELLARYKDLAEQKAKKLKKQEIWENRKEALVLAIQKAKQAIGWTFEKLIDAGIVGLEILHEIIDDYEKYAEERRAYWASPEGQEELKRLQEEELKKKQENEAKALKKQQEEAAKLKLAQEAEQAAADKKAEDERLAAEAARLKREQEEEAQRQQAQNDNSRSTQTKQANSLFSGGETYKPKSDEYMDAQDKNFWGMGDGHSEATTNAKPGSGSKGPY